MENPIGSEKKFSSIEDELSFLRSEVLKREKIIKENFDSPNRESIIRSEIDKYSQKSNSEVLTKGYSMLDAHVREITLELSPESHDKKIEELLGFLEQKGIKNTLSILQSMNNPHLEDDFHRFLVQYIKSGLSNNIDSSKEMTKLLKHTLYEVSVPPPEKDEKRDVKSFIYKMQEFYEGMISSFESLKNEKDSFAIEIANSEGQLDVIFYVAVPDSKKSVFEKQVFSVFPKARIFEKKDDYNIFNYEGSVSGAYAKLEHKAIFPIKTYDFFETDPSDVVINSISKLNQHKEGAALQIVFSPDYGEYLWSYKKALKDLENGVPLKDALDIKHTFSGHFLKATKFIAGGILNDFIMSNDKPEEKNNLKPKESSSSEVEEIKKKLSSIIVHTTIRLVTSAENSQRSDQILNEIMSSFGQFTNPVGNKIIWKKIDQKNILEFSREFSYRRFIKKQSIPMSTREITSLVHFPLETKSSPDLKTAHTVSAPPPPGVPMQGIKLGFNHDRNTLTGIFMAPEDRLRHAYVIGQTGTGKTTLLKNMIIQDIKNGEGVCFIDPHGSDIDDILASVPKERYKDVIYFDPGYTARPMALNMLEYDPVFPEQKTFVVNELLSIFNKLFDMKVAGGPMFEQYFRNSVQLVMDSPEEGNTLLEVMRVLSSKEFRALKLSKCKNPLVVQFWREIAEKAGGESSLANMVPYITNKFDVFLSNDIMRPIVLQEKSSFNMREIMDNKKIFLVNLSKGRLGDINANLIGLILVGKILMAALSRVDSFGKNMPPFYLYIDEFQNITTNSISQILSEARKYKLSLNIAHQFIAQLEDDIKDAVFGNVGTIASFRVGADDAEYLVKQFEPVFSANDLINIDNRNCCIKLLSNGKPLRAFSMETLPPEKGNYEVISKLKELSYLTFGQERSLVEDEIMNKYKNKTAPAPQFESPPSF